MVENTRRGRCGLAFDGALPLPVACETQAGLERPEQEVNEACPAGVAGHHQRDCDGNGRHPRGDQVSPHSGLCVIDAGSVQLERLLPPQRVPSRAA